MWTMMTRALAAIVLAAAFLTTPARAQDVLTPNPAIEGTIQSQIDAFLADDFVTAFTFASPSIRNIFRTPENFGAMVRNGYPMVWRPRDVRFGDLRALQGGLFQQVFVQDESGKAFVLEYRMVQIDGAWKISGVQVVPAPDIAA